MRAIFTALWAAGALGLSGCGGSNETADRTSVAAPPPTGTAVEKEVCADGRVAGPAGCLPTIVDARLGSVTAVEAAIERAVAERATASTPVAVSTTLRNTVGDAGVAVTGVALTVADVGGVVLDLDSEWHSVREPLKRFPLPRSPISVFDPVFSHGHEISDWTLYDYAVEGTSIAHATVSWDWQNPADHLSGGYWMRLYGDVALGDVSGADVGVFIDAPELTGARTSFPDTGTAVYQGHASGMYVYYYSAFWQHTPLAHLVDLEDAGVWSGVVRLQVDFDTGAVSGCIGCPLHGANANTITLETKAHVETKSGDRITTFADYINTENGSSVRIRLGEAYVGAMMSGDFVTDVDYPPGEAGKMSAGAWHGQFSDSSDMNGFPRTLGGALSGQWSNAEGDRAKFVGYFFGARPRDLTQ